MAPLKKLVGTTLETKKAKVTFKDLTSAGGGVGMIITVENLDKGNDATFIGPNCTIFDNAGNVYQPDDNQKLDLVGPGQTVEGTMIYPRVSQGMLSTILLVCYNNYDFHTGEGTMDIFSLN